MSILHTLAGGVNTAVTSALDTSLSNIIILSVGWFEASGTPTITDSKGNTWTALTKISHATNIIAQRLYYCANPSKGTGHTFQASLAGGYPTIAVIASDGNHTSFHSENGAGAGAQTVQTGSVTPPTNNALIVTGLTHAQDTTHSIDSGFTKTDEQAFFSPSEGLAMAYFVQGTAGAVNPTWTGTGNSNSLASAIAVFIEPPPDSTPPTVSITSPSTGGASISGNQSIGVNCADNIEVIQLDLMVDGDIVDTYTGSGITSHTFTLDTLRFANGDHVIKVRASDGTNTTDSSTITKTFANTFTITGDAKLASSASDTYTTNIPDPVWSKDSGGGSINASTGEYTAPSSGLGVAVLRATGEFDSTQTKNVLYGFPYVHNNGNSREFLYSELPEGYQFKARVKSEDEQGNTLGFTAWEEQP